MVIKHNIRDFFAYGAFISFSATYLLLVHDFLSFLTNPIPLTIIFSLSFIISCLYDLEGKLNRSAISRIIATAFIFTMAVPVAEWFHTILVDFVSQASTLPLETKEELGSEYFSALENKAFGIGTSLASSLTLIRLLLKNNIRTMTEILFVSKQHSEKSCPVCGNRVSN